ncbi:MAG: amidohydrolase family protein [Pseudomonadota bacterium]
MYIPSQITDAHHHLWDLSYCHYPWLMERGVTRFFGDPAPIQHDYLVKDLRADFADLPVTKSVHVQVGVALEDSVEETRWLQTCADKSGLPNAIVAFADLCAGDLGAVLDQHSECTAFRGVRQIFGRSAEEDAKSGTNTLLSNPKFAEGLRELAKRDLSFDLQLTPPLMESAAKVLRQIDGLKVALCHAGSPSDLSPSGTRQWLCGLAAIADIPGAICKLSGFGMFDHDWNRPYAQMLIEPAIELFGPHRIAFGSNFPVDKLYKPYSETMATYLEIVQGFAPAEIDAMFAGNADRFYRI